MNRWKCDDVFSCSYLYCVHYLNFHDEHGCTCLMFTKAIEIFLKIKTMKKFGSIFKIIERNPFDFS